MNVIKKMIVAGMVIMGMSSVNAQSVNTDENKLANKGYDVVNYFTTNTAEKGSIEYSALHNGATYYFVNAENLRTFKVNPSKYLPQFDGYCAFAVAKMSKKVPVNPETFRIDDGKLYLFYNDFWEGKPFNTIVPWNNNEAEMEKMAAANWKTLKSK
ncbi:YHS domain-containing (seleno)protein [Flagellimonas sp. CMM7]|uniref:YHS domain-containing (seleno)protein n=1 Tax=Flagellimonas sp. CMM7 TaxID=2654676 RepID=UPI0013D48D0F|nr:YHS domain-containing (seleno)protein [Flagellimonas sp. CMM7]UII79022.1 YHS domain protein [Flagellimonas sp. CMM7]